MSRTLLRVAPWALFFVAVAGLARLATPTIQSGDDVRAPSRPAAHWMRLESAAPSAETRVAIREPKRFHNGVELAIAPTEAVFEVTAANAGAPSADAHTVSAQSPTPKNPADAHGTFPLAPPPASGYLASVPPNTPDTHAPTSSAAAAEQDPPAPPSPTPPGSTAPLPAEPPKVGPDEEYVPGLGVLPKGPPPEYEGLGIQLRSHPDGQLVVGALVRSAVESEMAAWRKQGRDVDREDPEDILALSKGALPSGTPGYAISQSEPGRMLVDARLGQKYGYAWLNRSEVSRVTITLCDDTTLHFAAMDAEGTRIPDAPLCVRDARGGVLWRGRTNEEGRCALRHAALRLELPAEDGDFFVGVDALAPQSSTIRIRRGEFPTATIEVRIAEGASLAVSVKSPGGDPLPPGVPVVASAFDAGGRVLGVQTLITGANSKVRFERLPLDVKLSVRALGIDLYEDVEARTAAPKTLGAEAQLELRFVKRVPRVRGVIVDKKDKPLATQSVRAWITRRIGGEAVSSECTPCWSDAEGGFELALRDWKSAARLTLLVGDKPDFFWLTGEFELPEPPKEGLHTLSKARVVSPIGLAQGKVVDAARKPVTDARVTIARRVELANGTPVLVPEERWTVRTDDIGRFRVRGLPVTGSHVLIVQSDAHMKVAPIPIEIGETPREVTLVVAGSLAGQLLLPERVPAAAVGVTIEGPSGRRDLEVWSDGTFVARELEEGAWKAIVSLRGASVPLATVEEIQVRSGGRTRDGRIAPLDMTKTLHSIRVRVLDPEGKPVARGALTYTFHAEGREAQVTRELALGEADIVFTTSHVQAEVSADGFRPRKVGPTDEDATVRLERGG